MSKWLQDYANRVVLSFGVFALTGIGIVAVAMLTMIFHAIKASVANPVKSLRTE
jgi:putative ABC transport system permease protein